MKITSDIYKELKKLNKKICCAAGIPVLEGLPAAPPSSGSNVIIYNSAMYYWQHNQWNMIGGEDECECTELTDLSIDCYSNYVLEDGTYRFVHGIEIKSPGTNNIYMNNFTFSVGSDGYVTIKDCCEKCKCVKFDIGVLGLNPNELRDLLTPCMCCNNEEEDPLSGYSYVLYYDEIDESMHEMVITPEDIVVLSGDTEEYHFANGTVPRYALRGIVFGVDFLGVTSLGDGFLYAMFYSNEKIVTPLVDLRGLNNVTSVGRAFASSMFAYCINLESLPTIFNFPANIETVGDGFAESMFQNCSSLTSDTPNKGLIFPPNPLFSLSYTYNCFKSTPITPESQSPGDSVLIKRH